MSSARANASARNRRAGGDMQPPQQMQGYPGQPMQQQQMQMPAKLSVSDAIALITLRLGRLEQIVQNMPVDGQMGVGSDGENIRIVDNEVFENMAQRLDALEAGQKELAMRKPVLNTASPAPVTQVVNNAVTKGLSESVEVLKAEMVQVKDLLLNLQGFTMQTNQRLSDIVFNGGEFVETLDDTDGIISGNVVEDSAQNHTANDLLLDPTSLEEFVANP
jgi:hypothetical protein